MNIEGHDMKRKPLFDICMRFRFGLVSGGAVLGFVVVWFPFSIPFAPFLSTRVPFSHTTLFLS